MSEVVGYDPNFQDNTHSAIINRKRRKLPCVESNDDVEIHSLKEYYQPDVAHIAPGNYAHTSKQAMATFAMTYIPNQRTLVPGPELKSYLDRPVNNNRGVRISPQAVTHFKARYDDRMRFTERPNTELNMSDPSHRYVHV